MLFNSDNSEQYPHPFTYEYWDVIGQQNQSNCKGGGGGRISPSVLPLYQTLTGQQESICSHDYDITIGCITHSAKAYHSTKKKLTIALPRPKHFCVHKDRLTDTKVCTIIIT